MRRHSLVPGKRPKSRYRDSSPTVAEFVRWLYFRGKLKQRQIGELLGMQQGSISRIVSRQTWDATNP